MPDNSQNQVTWENVNSVFTNSFNDHRQDIQEHYDIAENNIKLGIKPSCPTGQTSSYEDLKKDVEDNLKKIDDTKNKIDEQLQKIEALRQPFQEQITHYDEKIKSINDQINNINAFLEESCSKLPNGDKDEDIQKLKAKKAELESLLPGFIEQKKALEEKAQEIESFPNHLFKKSSDNPPQPNTTTDNPWLIMSIAKDLSSKLSASLSKIHETCTGFFAALNSILQKAKFFFQSNSTKVDSLITSSNSLMETIREKLSLSNSSSLKSS